MRAKRDVHPCFKSVFKCIDTYKMFTQGVSYEITGFGNDFRNGKKVDVWYIAPLGSDKEFSVIKETVNVLIDNKTLKILEDA